MLLAPICCGQPPFREGFGAGAPEPSSRSAGFSGKHCFFQAERKNEMRLSLLAAFLIALLTLPAEAARPVKGAVQGTATAATGIAKGAGQAGVGVVRGTRTAVSGTARGLRCVATLGNRC
jgi:hypothetical protein